MKRLAVLFKALSDETRLVMMALLLRHGELCVCDFVRVLGVTQSKASRHLRYLLHAGLVQDRRDGVWVHYRVHESPGPEGRAMLEAVKPLLDRLDLGACERDLERWLAGKAAAAEPCRVNTESAPSIRSPA